MKDVIAHSLKAALAELASDHDGFDADAIEIQLSVPSRRDHGDWSSNVALVAGGLLDIRDRRGLAEQLASGLTFPEGTIRRVEVAGPGFLNFFIDDAWYQNLVARIVAEDAAYGRLDIGAGQTVLVEFVSANPTGPLTIGHGRNAILGDVVARLYEAAGFAVTREYYFNNAGRQMRVLGESVRARYLELIGLPAELPEDGYQGEYVIDIARGLLAERGDGLANAPLDLFREAGERAMFADIQRTCAALGIAFDSFYGEHTLYESGAIDEVVDQLKRRELAYEADGATWFRATACGLERDVVLIKSSGEPTYRLPDMAYHRHKLRRGFDHIIDVFGADHIDTCQEVLAAIRALGDDTSRIHVIIYQFVTLQRGGQQVKMSTRKATFETLDGLLEEVGADAVRFFFAMRSPRSHMEFDLELATKRANDNPLYYVQYSHARLCSLFARPEAADLEREPLDLSALVHEAERELVAHLALLPDALRRALDEHEPHRLTEYARDVATAFHQFYDRCPVLNATDRRVGRARLELCRAARCVVRNVLGMIGVTAPESM